MNFKIGPVKGAGRQDRASRQGPIDNEARASHFYISAWKVFLRAPVRPRPPIPDMKPAAKTDQPVASSRTLEVVDLISDDEKDVDFPSPPTRKGKERARAQQQQQPLVIIKDDDDEEELPSTGALLKRARAHSPAAATSSKRQALITAYNYGAPSSSSSSLPAVSHQAAPTSRVAGSTTSPAKMATSSAVARATPQWPTQKNIPQWLRDLKEVYDANPNKFYQHVDTWFDVLETKVRLGRVDDYTNWISLNYGESRCEDGADCEGGVSSTRNTKDAKFGPDHSQRPLYTL